MLQSRIAADFILELRDPLAKLGFLAATRGGAQLEQLAFAADRRNEFRRSVVEQFLRDDQIVGAVSLAGKTSLAGAHLIQSLGVDGEAGTQGGFVEPHQCLTGTNTVAFANHQLSDDTAGEMLDFLDIGVDDHRSSSGDRSRQLGRGGPAADPAGQTRHQNDAGEQMMAHAAIFAICRGGHVDAAG